ncbi:MAG: nucleoside-diphosphate sugar epimerase [Phycisphaerae bacterium]|nr:nucleoside-diphosphate sugar epimerase [Phycisphaerae bacterium]|tara:strand:- start:822 stop:1817 length:996 start_codon:yes stop_codon:yes gene_type:complete
MSSSESPRHILVTGGAGFIGSHLVERILNDGDRVTVVDDLSTGSWDNLAGCDDSRVSFIHQRVSTALDQLDPSSFDEIHHLAAAVGVRLVVEQPVHVIETNVHETLAILRFASSSRVPTLLASTSEVYGKSENVPFREDADLVFGPTTEPRWSYACSKAIDEFLGLAWYRDHGLPVVIARFFNTVGPRQRGKWGMVLPRFVKAALAGEPLQVYGTGSQTRCFCDVRDVVEVLPSIVRNESMAGTVINVGRDESISILSLAELVIDVLASDSKIEFLSYEKAYGHEIEDMIHRRPDVSRLRSAFDFTPCHELVQTISDIATFMSDVDEGMSS